MFMTSNQFRVIKGHEETFEKFWLIKQASFQSAPGFVSYRFTRGREHETVVIYMALTVWENEESFLAWRFGRGGDGEWIDTLRPGRQRHMAIDRPFAVMKPQ